MPAHQNKRIWMVFTFEYTQPTKVLHVVRHGMTYRAAQLLKNELVAEAGCIYSARKSMTESVRTVTDDPKRRANSDSVVTRMLNDSWGKYLTEHHVPPLLARLYHPVHPCATIQYNTGFTASW